MKTNAFTLLEIVIAMLILAIVTAGAYGLFVSNYKLLTMANHDYQAINQAAKVMEKLRVYVAEVMVPELPTGASLVLGAGNHDRSEDFTRIGLATRPDIPGASGQEWSYFVDNDIAGPNSKKVTVTVRWDEP